MSAGQPGVERQHVAATRSACRRAGRHATDRRRPHAGRNDSYPDPYSTGRGLSLIPPSTATYVRTPGICLIVPTVYTVIAAGGDDRPARFDADLRAHAERVARVEQHVAPLRDRRRLLALDVGDAEPAAEHELGQVERHGEVGHHLGRLGERRRLEHVRSDVAVHADQLDRRRPACPVDRSHRVAVAEVEAELRVVLSGGDELVGVGVHARRDAQQDLRRRADAVAGERVEAVELVEGVDDDVAHAGLDRHPQLGDGSCCCRAACTPTPARRRRARRGARRRTPTSSSIPSSYASLAIARHRKALVA